MRAVLMAAALVVAFATSTAGQEFVDSNSDGVQLGAPIVVPTRTATPTWIRTATATATATSEPVLSPSRTPHPCAACPGDQNGDGTVTVAELVRAVRAAAQGCP